MTKGKSSKKGSKGKISSGKGIQKSPSGSAGGGKFESKRGRRISSPPEPPKRVPTSNFEPTMDKPIAEEYSEALEQKTREVFSDPEDCGLGEREEDTRMMQRYHEGLSTVQKQALEAAQKGEKIVMQTDSLGQSLEGKTLSKVVGGVEVPAERDFGHDVAAQEVERFNARERDPISAAVGSDPFMNNHTWDFFRDLAGRGMYVSRFYYEKKLAIDIFRAEGLEVEEEIKRKRRLLKEHGIKYLAVRKGEVVTAGRIRDILDE